MRIWADCVVSNASLLVFLFTTAGWSFFGRLGVGWEATVPSGHLLRAMEFRKFYYSARLSKSVYCVVII